MVGSVRCGVYFIQSGPGGPLKIGSAQDIRARLWDLQAGSPWVLSVVAWIPTAPTTRSDRGVLERRARQRLERELHEKFARHLMHREWYEPAAEIMAYISVHGHSYDNPQDMAVSA